MKVFKGRIFWRKGQGLYLLPLCAKLCSDWLVVQLKGGVLGVFCSAEGTILHLGGGLSSCRRTQRYCSVYPLRRSQDPAPRLHYFFLTAPPLLLRPLPPLINNSLNLPPGTQGRSKRLNEVYSLHKNWGHGKGFLPGRAPQGPAVFLYDHSCHNFFI